MSDQIKPVAIVNSGMGGIEWLEYPLADDEHLYCFADIHRLQAQNARLLEALKRIVDGVPEYFEHDGRYGTVHRDEHGVYCGFEVHDPKMIIDSILGVANAAIIAAEGKSNVSM